MSRGSTLADFKLEDRVGKGSFGSVYKAIRKSDGRTYAVKKVNIKTMPQAEREDALNEIRVLASLQNMHILAYCDAFLDASNLYIVTDFARRGDLAGKIKKNAKSRKYFPEKEIWTYFVQICVGIDYLHSKKFLHRDLKPANVFCYSSRHLVIGDLGCSLLLKQKLPRMQVGTPYYMAPEIWAHQSYSEPCDVWSLGVLLHECAALQPPFQGHDLKSLGQNVKVASVPRISSQYTKDLQNVIDMCLKKDPRKRPSIGDLMKISIIAKYASRIPDLLSESKAMLNQESSAAVSPRILRTIEVPRNIRDVRLPPSRYPAGSDCSQKGPQSARAGDGKERKTSAYMKAALDVNGPQSARGVENRQGGGSKMPQSKIPPQRSAAPTNHRAQPSGYAQPRRRY